MRDRTRELVLLAAILIAAPSCFTTTHTVGGGPTGTEVVSDRQWYVLWGLFRVAPFDDGANLAGNATSYRITTEWTVTDLLMNLFTGVVSVVSQTITVEK